MPTSAIDAVVGGAVLALANFWHSRFIPLLPDGPPSFRALLQSHPPAVAYTTGQISVGILLPHILPTLFQPSPFSHIPLPRLIFSSALLSAGATLANACPHPHLASLPSLSRPLPHLLAFLSAMLFATLFASSRFFSTPFSAASSPDVSSPASSSSPLPSPSSLIVLLATATIPPLVGRVRAPPTPLLLEVVSYVLGVLVALSLVVSGILHPSTLLSSLDMEADLWQPLGLLTILSACLTFCALPTTLPTDSTPVVDLEKLGREPMPCAIPSSCHVCRRAVAAAVLLGAGLGLAGVSPTCALVYFGAFPASVESLAVVGTMLLTTIVCSTVLSALDDPLTEALF